MHLKGGDGLLYWPSQRFPQAVAQGFEAIDYPQLLIEEGAKRGVEVHAWLIDFFDGGPALKEHPDWAMLDPHGRPTADQALRGQPFGCNWMCPARRPGYTDQWLVPALAEFAQMYPVASIHHDYVRYPGDVAPDTYCFCDYCIENIPRWAGYTSNAFPDEPFLHELYDRPFLESHWEQSPRVLPAAWSRWDRSTKARFLLDGSFFQGGRGDLDYFFYTFRVEAILGFVREAAAAVRRVRPGTKLSAAVFKNPVHSGRFIGQDWRRFSPYVDILIPMDYRDHFPGSFEEYLALLAEAISRQQDWAAEFEQLAIGVAVNFLFKEEPAGPWPTTKLERVMQTIESSGASGAVIFCDEQLERYGQWGAMGGPRN